MAAPPRRSSISEGGGGCRDRCWDKELRADEGVRRSSFTARAEARNPKFEIRNKGMRAKAEKQKVKSRKGRALPGQKSHLLGMLPHIQCRAWLARVLPYNGRLFTCQRAPRRRTDGASALGDSICVAGQGVKGNLGNWRGGSWPAAQGWLRDLRAAGLVGAGIRSICSRAIYSSILSPSRGHYLLRRRSVSGQVTPARQHDNR